MLDMGLLTLLIQVFCMTFILSFIIVDGGSSKVKKYFILITLDLYIDLCETSGTQ